jgi:murein DD-endopeptidase MepM/ murein hydrolase activator NlpD
MPLIVSRAPALFVAMTLLGTIMWAGRRSGMQGHTSGPVPVAAVVLHLKPVSLPVPASLGGVRRHPGNAAPANDVAPAGAAAALAPGRLHWPALGRVTSRFGWRIHPIFRTREFHTGLDIATRWGSPVLAARRGIVRFAGWASGYGEMVVLEHAHGMETRYSHLSRLLVRAGERVNEGQPIGQIGSTGWSTGPHLFFEVRRNGVAVDPAPYLDRSSVSHGNRGDRT